MAYLYRGSNRDCGSDGAEDLLKQGKVTAENSQPPRSAGKWGCSLEIAKRNPTKILEEKEGWLKVITEQIGWVKKDFVSTG